MYLPQKNLIPLLYPNKLGNRGISQTVFDNLTYVDVTLTQLQYFGNILS